MAEEQKCKFCGKPATVHLTQITNGKVQKLNLCEECAQSKGVVDMAATSLSNLIGQALDDLVQGKGVSLQTAITCPNCGFTSKDMQEKGRMGCPDCYKVFESILLPNLTEMHKSTVHTGKTPSQSLERRNLFDRIQKLNQELQTAVNEERYEDAAQLRDELKHWKTCKKKTTHGD